MCNYDMVDDTSEHAQRLYNLRKSAQRIASWDEIKVVRVVHYSAALEQKRADSFQKDSDTICGLMDNFLRSSYE